MARNWLKSIRLFANWCEVNSTLGQLLRSVWDQVSLMASQSEVTPQVSQSEVKLRSSQSEVMLDWGQARLISIQFEVSSVWGQVTFIIAFWLWVTPIGLVGIKWNCRYSNWMENCIFEMFIVLTTLVIIWPIFMIWIKLISHSISWNYFLKAYCKMSTKGLEIENKWAKKILQVLNKFM